MIEQSELLALQSAQRLHDVENHLDIWALHKMERLKHYGLHFCKYVGRLARGEHESKSVSQTLVDAFLVSLSAANALNQELAAKTDPEMATSEGNSYFSLSFADAAGRFADACEKIDHLEEFRAIALEANRDIMIFILTVADRQEIDLLSAVTERRKQLYQRQVYHKGIANDLERGKT